MKEKKSSHLWANTIKVLLIFGLMFFVHQAVHFIALLFCGYPYEQLRLSIFFEANYPKAVLEMSFSNQAIIYGSALVFHISLWWLLYSSTEYRHRKRVISLMVIPLGLTLLYFFPILIAIGVIGFGISLLVAAIVGQTKTFISNFKLPDKKVVKKDKDDTDEWPELLHENENPGWVSAWEYLKETNLLIFAYLSIPIWSDGSDLFGLCIRAIYPPAEWYFNLLFWGLVAIFVLVASMSIIKEVRDSRAYLRFPRKILTHWGKIKITADVAGQLIARILEIKIDEELVLTSNLNNSKLDLMEYAAKNKQPIDIRMLYSNQSGDKELHILLIITSKDQNSGDIETREVVYPKVLDEIDNTW